MKIFLATGNTKKIKEMKTILAEKHDIQILSLQDGIDIPEVEENGDTFEANAKIKALAIAKYLNMPTIADDSGLCVDALGGAPGVLSARYAGTHGDDEANNTKLMAEMTDVASRRARFVCAIALSFPDGETHTFVGEIHGEITDGPQGNNGFGYDPYFYVPEYGKTTAEMTDVEKNKISHRGNALRKLMDAFDNIMKSKGC